MCVLCVLLVLGRRAGLPMPLVMLNRMLKQVLLNRKYDIIVCWKPAN